MSGKRDVNKKIEEDNNNNNSVRKSWSSLVVLLLTVILFMIVSGILFGLEYNNIYKEKTNYMDMTEKLNKENNEITSQNLKLVRTMVEYEKEITLMKERLAGIKDNDDLLRRDIFMYIDKKFQFIPKTLAADIAVQVIAKSKDAEVSPELIVGIIEVESSFNPMAVSSKNARGLMQVMPEWAKKFKLKKVSDLHDVSTNIECGIKVLKIHIKENKGSITKGLYHYVGKSDSYASKVYSAMGKFVAFRSTIDDDSDEGKEEAKNSATVKGAGTSS